jgi:hypothetical protein
MQHTKVAGERQCLAHRDVSEGLEEHQGYRSTGNQEAAEELRDDADGRRGLVKAEKRNGGPRTSDQSIGS